MHKRWRARQLGWIPFIRALAQIRMIDDREHLAVLQLRIVLHAIFRALHHGGDNAGSLALTHEVVTPPRARPAADDGIELILMRDTRFVGGELRGTREAWLMHQRAQRLELRLRLARDKHPPMLPDAIVARTAVGVVRRDLRKHCAVARREIRAPRAPAI